MNQRRSGTGQVFVMELSRARQLKNMRHYWFTIVFTAIVVGKLWIRGCAGECTSNSSLVGFTADLSMVQHQLRGSVHIVDDCTFTVTRFDMLEGVEVYWWKALGDDFDSLMSGQPVSKDTLTGTFLNATLEVTLQGFTWDDLKVLSVWDKATASNFGHIVLQPVSIALPPESGNQVALGPPPRSGPSTGPGVAPSPSFSLSETPPAPPPRQPLQKVGQWQPTMFDNCVALTRLFRVRWTLNVVPGTVDIGLEFALTKTQYMAFGWAKPGSTEGFMLYSDVVIAGIDDKGVPISEDYYISAYMECNWDTVNPAGVCPDSFFAGSKNVGLNNSQMVYGRQVDGITLVRYRRPLESGDVKYDVTINTTKSMTVVWAMGSLKPADSSRAQFTPQNHGSPMGVKYGYMNLTIGQPVDQCLGPLAASNASQGNIVVADRGTSLQVTADISLEYPNPPNPKKVLYINQKESPILKVERGVPVTFLVEAGHDVSLYITSDPIGGHTGKNETIFAGGADAHGVQTTPHSLTWLPDRSTPDEVFYQGYYQRKMGWKVQVVDGGLSDMYNTSAPLADNEVTLFWTSTSSDVYFAVRGERKSGYLAIAFGSGMVNAFAYVGWIDGQGVGHISTYWIDDKDASGIHPTAEELSNKKCERQDGIITFEFSRPLQPVCKTGKECKNVMDPASAMKMVWAMGDEWSDQLTNGNIHTLSSSTPTLIYLANGAAKVEQLQPVLAVHGFMMFLAWGMFLPGGVLAARYMKHVDQKGWLQIHIYAQSSAIAVTVLGLLFAIAELRGLNTGNAHMKLGITSFLLACMQASNGFLRPKKLPPGEPERLQRVVWRYIHLYSGRGALLLGFITLFTGIGQLGDRNGLEHVRSLQGALSAWFLAIVAIAGYIEFQDSWIRGHQYKSAQAAFEGQIIGEEEDDSADLLPPIRDPFLRQNSKAEARGMEVQLEAF